MTLYELPVGGKAKIKKIKCDNKTKERLHSLGFIKGISVKTIKRAPLGCPVIYKILNTLVALRGNIAKQIYIENGEK